MLRTAEGYSEGRKGSPGELWKRDTAVSRRFLLQTQTGRRVCGPGNQTAEEGQAPARYSLRDLVQGPSSGTKSLGLPTYRERLMELGLGSVGKDSINGIPGGECVFITHGL